MFHQKKQSLYFVTAKIYRHFSNLQMHADGKTQSQTHRHFWLIHLRFKNICQSIDTKSNFCLFIHYPKVFAVLQTIEYSTVHLYTSVLDLNLSHVYKTKKKKKLNSTSASVYVTFPKVNSENGNV